MKGAKDLSGLVRRNKPPDGAATSGGEGAGAALASTKDEKAKLEDQTSGSVLNGNGKRKVELSNDDDEKRDDAAATSTKRSKTTD